MLGIVVFRAHRAGRARDFLTERSRQATCPKVLAREMARTVGGVCRIPPYDTRASRDGGGVLEDIENDHSLISKIDQAKVRLSMTACLSINSATDG